MLRHILAQLITNEDLESLDAAELRAMLSELDDQFIVSQDMIEVSVPA